MEEAARDITALGSIIVVVILSGAVIILSASGRKTWGRAAMLISVAGVRH